LKFLLDTNVLSLVARLHRKATERYEKHLEECSIPAVVWHELRHGVQKMKSGAIKRQFLDFYDTLALPILPYDRVAAEFHASERARIRSSKYADGQIAAIAVTRGLTLVTANTSDFKAFRDLRLEDWSR